jgi:dTDP-4-dehydrorhamnose reductase
MSIILLTGKSGQVGWELQRTLMPLGRIVALGADELDLANPTVVRQAVRSIQPDVIVNTAAYNAVDRAESEADLAHAVNGVAPGILAEEAQRLNAWMMHYSTDYIFDGIKTGAYTETDTPNPQNIYGRSKLAGENAVREAGGKHLILRTSWVYGSRGYNFMLTMLRLARERRELRIVDDQIGAPTWCRSLAEISAQILAQLHVHGMQGRARDLSGTYHLTSSGSVSWHGFAAEILRLTGMKPMPELVAIPSNEYPTPATRPKNSVLSNEKLNRTFGLAAGDWRDNLRLCLQEMR